MQLFKKKHNNTGGRKTGLSLTAQTADFHFAESFTTLRTNLLLSLFGKNGRTLLVSSAAPSEGKTLTAVNLGYSLAQTGKKILLVDTDLRKPKLSRFVDAPKDAGITRLFVEALNHSVYTGSLAEFSTSDLLWLLAFHQASGILRLIHEKTQLQLYFEKGQLFDLQWLGGTSDKRLLRLLPPAWTAPGRNLPFTLKNAPTGHRLASLLVRSRVLSHDEMGGFVKRHLEEGLKQALRLRTGHFGFKKAEFSGKHAGRLPFDLSGLSYLHWQVAPETKPFVFLEKSIKREIVQSKVKNLAVLPCGLPPHNPSEMLASTHMDFLIYFLKQHFDIVIFDTPPIIPASDALVLAPRVDGAIVVTHAGVSDRKMIRKAVTQLQAAKTEVLGVVLNQVDFKKDSYYYRYQSKYYGHYYGEGRRQKSAET